MKREIYYTGVLYNIEGCDNDYDDEWGRWTIAQFTSREKAEMFMEELEDILANVRNIINRDDSWLLGDKLCQEPLWRWVCNLKTSGFAERIWIEEVSAVNPEVMYSCN